MRSEGWCRRRDLNPHGFPHHPLKCQSNIRTNQRPLLEASAIKSVMEHSVPIAFPAVVDRRRELLRRDDFGETPHVLRVQGAPRRTVAVQAGTGVGAPHKGNYMGTEGTQGVHPLEEAVCRFQSHDEHAVDVARSEYADSL